MDLILATSSFRLAVLEKQSVDTNTFLIVLNTQTLTLFHGINIRLPKLLLCLKDFWGVFLVVMLGSSAFVVLIAERQNRNFQWKGNDSAKRVYITLHWAMGSGYGTCSTPYQVRISDIQASTDSTITLSLAEPDLRSGKGSGSARGRCPKCGTSPRSHLQN